MHRSRSARGMSYQHQHKYKKCPKGGFLTFNWTRLHKIIIECITIDTYCRLYLLAAMRQQSRTWMALQHSLLCCQGDRGLVIWHQQEPAKRMQIDVSVLDVCIITVRKRHQRKVWTAPMPAQVPGRCKKEQETHLQSSINDHLSKLGSQLGLWNHSIFSYFS